MTSSLPNPSIGPLTVRSPIITPKPRPPDDEQKLRQQRYLKKVPYSREICPLPPLVDSSHFRPTEKDCVYFIETLHGGDLRKLRGKAKLLAKLDVWISYLCRHDKHSLMRELGRIGLSEDMKIVICALRMRILGRRNTRARPRLSLQKLGQPRWAIQGNRENKGEDEHDRRQDAEQDTHVT